MGVVIRLKEGSSIPVNEEDKQAEILCAVSGILCGDKSRARQSCLKDMKNTRVACATGSHLACEPTTTGSLLANKP